MAGAHSFGRYRVTRTLGAGAMGEVYEAVDDVLGREVAVKTLKGGATGLAARMLDERFRLEARAIAALAHPGVVQVFDIDLTADPPYLVMERVAGPSLKEQLAGGPLSNSQLRALGIQIGNALAAAHAAKILHRDVKPANILCAGTGRWKLADFGVAHVPDSSLTMTGQFVGSPAYAPPEALVRGQSGPEGDVFGLGATLYQAAAGRWPRAEETQGGLLAPVRPLRELAPDVDETIADVIDRAVAIEPSQRPTAAELAEQLASGISRPVTIPPSGPVAIPQTPVPISRNMATEFVEDSRPGTFATPLATVAPVAAKKAPPWKAIAIASGALLLLLVVAIASDSGTGAKPAASGAGASTAPVETPPPSTPKPAGEHRIVADPPKTDDPQAIAHWNEIAHRIHGGDLDGARRLLDDYEEEFGQSSETRNLASQLDAIPRSARPPPGKFKGRGKKKKGD